jgi:ASC-1-like (ASCH) protein
MENKKHQLKILPEYFQAIAEGEKTFEIRRNDRDYQVGDELFLNEFDPEKQKYTGRREKVKVSYITDYAQVENYIVMGIIFT